MKTVKGIAFARAGLLGNPSDGYNGKTISLIVKNYSACVTLTESQRLTFVPSENESNEFESLTQFASSIDEQGYYGGIRLLKAATKRFFEFCKLTEQSVDGQSNFSIAFHSDIPRQVGLAGSSAIVTAALRALSEWHNLAIPPHLLASLTLSAESELGIPAGLQDRVIQAYEGLVYMDFSEAEMQVQHELTYGHYESLDTGLIGRLYIAFASNAGEPTEVLHNDLRKRYNEGDSGVRNAMVKFAELAEQGKQAILQNDSSTLGELIDENYDLRASICQLHVEHQRMIRVARECGASAKYCGSGGAIIGTYFDDDMFAQLEQQMAAINCLCIKPILA